MAIHATGSSALGHCNPAHISSLLGSQNVVWLDPKDLKPFPTNARKHPAKQIFALARAIQEQGWTNPILIDEHRTILMGHGRGQAAKHLGLSQIPTLTLQGLSETQKKAIVIADNRLAERAEWDMDLLRGELGELIAANFEVDLTGFTTGEVDIILDGAQEAPAVSDPDDNFEPAANDVAISQLGDLWQLGTHRLLCGDARTHQSHNHVLLQTVERVVIQKTSLRIELAEAANHRKKILEVPWTPKPGRPSREVLESVGTTDGRRPMRSDVRASLLKAIALGRSWLQELTDGTVNDTNEIARREDRSKRSVHMTMSLAFLAPDIIEAAIGGQLPRRIGITRLADLPSDWRKQREMLGLRQPS